MKWNRIIKFGIKHKSPNTIFEMQVIINCSYCEGVTVLDQILSVLGMTHMFVGGAVALFLDNTIPGENVAKSFSNFELFSFI